MYILTWKRASRHNGVQFFISHLASWLRTRRFSEPTFRPAGATNHWKNTVFRDFPTFSRICIIFLLILSLLTLLTSAFQLSILSEVSLLNFLRTIKHLQGANSCLFGWTFRFLRLVTRLASHIRYMTACERGGILPTPLDFITGGSSTLDAANWALADCHSAPVGRRKMLGVAAGKQGFDGDFGCFQLISPIKNGKSMEIWEKKLPTCGNY